MGGIVRTGVQFSSVHHPDSHYDHLYAALRSGARIARIVLVKGRPVEGLFGLQFELYNEVSLESEKGSLPGRRNQRFVDVGFSPSLDGFLQNDALAVKYVDDHLEVYGLRSFPVYVPSSWETKDIEELFEETRGRKNGKRKNGSDDERDVESA